MTSPSAPTALITGGALGIGGATARRLAQDGANVVIADVDADAARDNAERIIRDGGKALAVRADVSRSADVEAAVAAAVSEFGGLDTLVNNAVSSAIWGGDKPIADISDADFDAGMGILVKSHFAAIRSAVPHMRAAGGGAIVNISSVHGMFGAPGALIYETGKAAVIGITRQLATELGPDGIRVNAICPGHIVTERGRESWDANPTGLAFFEDQYPIRRVGKPEDIAAAVAFLCSADAGFITGHALVVDGGLTAQLQENLAVRQAHYIQRNPDTRLPY